MRYTSTRDRMLSVTFEQAICSGYAADGGLFVPQMLPKVEECLKPWSKMTYPELSFSVLRLFISPGKLLSLAMMVSFILAVYFIHLHAHLRTRGTVGLRPQGSLRLDLSWIRGSRTSSSRDQDWIRIHC